MGGLPLVMGCWGRAPVKTLDPVFCCGPTYGVHVHHVARLVALWLLERMPAWMRPRPNLTFPAGAAMAGLCQVAAPADVRARPGAGGRDRRQVPVAGAGGLSRPAPTFPGAGEREGARSSLLGWPSLLIPAPSKSGKPGFGSNELAPLPLLIATENCPGSCLISPSRTLLGSFRRCETVCPGRLPSLLPERNK